MTKKQNSKKKYIRHSKEFKQEALKLAEQSSVSQAAKQLGLHDSQLYSWRKQAEHEQTISERESQLATENVRLKRELNAAKEELAIAKKAATYFAKQLK